MNHVFESFFTTRTSGTGMGFSILRPLVEAHDGNITLVHMAAGACATLVIPGVVQGVPA
jgi:signal transduction histidine kinase